MRISSNRQSKKITPTPLTSILPHPHNKNQLFITGLQGNIYCYTITPLTFHKSYKIFTSYCTCLFSITTGLCTGSSSGQFVYLNYHGQILKYLQLFNDCLSSIVSCDSYLVASSYNGQIKFLNKIYFTLEKVIQLYLPIWNIIFFDNRIYAAGNPSFSINCNTFQIQKLKRFNSFSTFNNKLYGCSDQRGLTCLTTNSNSYIPCNIIISLKDRLILLSQQCATQLKHEHQMQWRCHRIKQIQKNIQITSGCSIDNIIILGDNQGNLYKFQYQIVDNYCRN